MRGAIILAAAASFLVLSFQNCVPGSHFATDSQTESASEAASLPESHPAPDEQKIGSTKAHIVPKAYVASLFQEVFTSAKYKTSNLEALIDKWVRNRAPQYGGACNMYSSYSTKDCAASLANTDLDHFVDGSTLRASYIIQLCENVIGQDTAVSAALEKTNLLVTSPVTKESITAVYGLFYRNDPPEDVVLSTLLDLDQSLAAQNAPLKERWRAQLAQICESPAWQLF